MSSVRVEKFEKQMLRDMGEIFQQKSQSWFNGAFITVSQVHSSPDLSFIKCYVSILNEKEKGSTMELIEEKLKEIRMELTHRNKHMRKAPEIAIKLDTSLEYVSKMEAIFNEINNKKKQ